MTCCVKSRRRVFIVMSGWNLWKLIEDGEKVEWAIAAVLRGVKDAYAASLYHVIFYIYSAFAYYTKSVMFLIDSRIFCSTCLHPRDVSAPLLPATSHVHVQVEQTRLELLKWIGSKDVHSLTSTFDTDTRRTVLTTAYFFTAAAFKAREIDASPKQESALLSRCFVQKGFLFFAFFSGQGTNEVYFDELQNLYDMYKPFVAPFVQTVTEDVLAPLVSEEASTHYMFGLDVVSWPLGATARPAVPYLASVPALIGLTHWQLVQYFRLVVRHICSLFGCERIGCSFCSVAHCV